ncbi:hypothetical protein HDA40_002411 [Hamadaea flava]|uniref:Outer membrane channel protein CpnT-like N-terminal domain-containing protein n=1 Tax=Hamadaea flava TaxID=1742688 RepID=A0ABV8LM90_9ACTN|nr:hypothetical protein [Hamadaea flava]MCP2323904.1 hypothetical protein [Hamadaea flava]
MIELWDFGEPWNEIRDALIWLGSGGSGWPQANEDQIRELAAAWRSVGERLQSGLSEANSAAADLVAAWGGDGGAAFAKSWQSLGHDVPQMLVDILLNGYDGNPPLVGSLEQSALDIEYDKISTLVEVAVVIIEIFVILVTAWLAFWAAWTAAGMRIAMGRAAIWAFMRGLIANAVRSFGQHGLSEGLKQELKQWAKHAIKWEVAKEIGAETGVDITAQLAQFAMGTRTSWDGKKTLASGIGGAAGALLSFATPIGENIAGKFTSKLGKTGINLGTRALDEFITEVGAETIANGVVYKNWNVNLGNLGNRIGSGMVRDKVSENADLSGNALDVTKSVLGLETRTQAAANAARQAAQNAANQAQTAAQQARQQATQAQQAANAATQQAQAAQQRANEANAAAQAAVARYGADSVQAREAATAAQNATRQAEIAQRGATQATAAAQHADTAAGNAEDAARQARENADRIPAPAGGTQPEPGTQPDDTSTPPPGTGPDGSPAAPPGTGPDGSPAAPPGTRPDGSPAAPPGTGPDGSPAVPPGTGPDGSPAAPPGTGPDGTPAAPPGTGPDGTPAAPPGTGPDGSPAAPPGTGPDGAPATPPGTGPDGTPGAPPVGSGVPAAPPGTSPDGTSTAPPGTGPDGAPATPPLGSGALRSPDVDGQPLASSDGETTPRPAGMPSTDSPQGADVGGDQTGPDGDQTTTSAPTRPTAPGAAPVGGGRGTLNTPHTGPDSTGVLPTAPVAPPGRRRTGDTDERTSTDPDNDTDERTSTDPDNDTDERTSTDPDNDTDERTSTDPENDTDENTTPEGQPDTDENTTPEGQPDTDGTAKREAGSNTDETGTTDPNTSADTNDDTSDDSDTDETAKPDANDDTDADGDQRGDTDGSTRTATKVSPRVTIAIAKLVMDSTVQAQMAAHEATRANALAQVLASTDGQVQITGPTSLTLDPDAGPDDDAQAPSTPPMGPTPLQGLLPDDSTAAGSQADVQRLFLMLGINPGDVPPLHPHPAGPWVGAANDGGPTVAGRSDNCLLFAASVHSTYFGHPSVAPANRTGRGFNASVLTTWAAAPFTAGDRNQGFADIEEQLRQQLGDDMDAGPMAFVAALDPLDSNVAHMYAVFARREPDPSNPGENHVVFYYADNNSTAAEATRPQVSPGTQLSSIMFDHAGTAVQPETALADDDPLLSAEIQGRPTNSRVSDLLGQIDTLLTTTGVPPADVLDDIERRLDEMGLIPGGTPVRWARLGRLSAGSTTDQDAFVTLMQEPGWRAAYERAAAMPNHIAEGVTGDPNPSAARTVALASAFATNPAPAYAGRPDTQAIDQVAAMISRMFGFEHAAVVTRSGNDLQITFDSIYSRSLRVEYAVLPPGQQVRLDWNGDDRFRLTVAHDADLTTPAARAEIQVRLAREIARIRLGGMDFRADDGSDRDMFGDVLQAYAGAGVNDVQHVLMVNRPAGQTGDTADVAAAVRLTQQSRAETARIMTLLQEAARANPRAAEAIVRLIAAEASWGDQLGSRLAPLLADLTLPTGSDRRAQRERTRTLQLVAATAQLAAAGFAQEFRNQGRQDSALLPSLIEAVDRARFALTVARARLASQNNEVRGVIRPRDAAFSPSIVATADRQRAALLTELNNRRADANAARPDPQGIVLPPLAGNAARLDSSLQRTLRNAAARLGFAEPSAEAVMLGRWGGPLHALGSQDPTPSTAEIVDGARTAIRQTIEDPTRVTVQDGDTGDARVLFQRTFTDAQGNQHTVAVTVHVQRSVNDRTAYVSDVRVTPDTRTDHGRPMHGQPAHRVRSDTRLVPRRQVRDSPDRVRARRSATRDSAVNEATRQALQALGVTLVQHGNSTTYDLTWPNGDGPARVRITTGRVRGGAVAEVRPPRFGDPTWEIRIPSRGVTRTGMMLDVAEALGLALGLHQDRESGRVTTQLPQALGRAARLAAVGHGQAIVAAPPAGTTWTPSTRRLSAEVHALVEDLQLRMDQPQYADRRSAVDTLLTETFGAAPAAAATTAVDQNGAAVADIADPAARRDAEAARRAAEVRGRGRMVTDILLGQHQPGMTSQTPVIGDLRTRGPALTGTDLADHIANTLPDIVTERGLTELGHRRDGDVTTTIVSHDGLAGGPVTVRVETATLPAGIAADTRIDLTARTVTVFLAEGLTADAATIHLLGEVTRSLETIGRVDARQTMPADPRRLPGQTREARERIRAQRRENERIRRRPIVPADILGDHPLNRRMHNDVYGASPSDAALAAQIQHLAEALATRQDPRELLNLVVMLHRAGVRNGQPHAELRRAVLSRLLTDTVAQQVNNLLNVDETLARAIEAGLPPNLESPAANRSVGRRRFTVHLPIGIDSTGSLSTPPHQPLHPTVRRVAGRNANRVERYVAARRFKISRMGADAIANAQTTWGSRTLRTVLWAPKYLRARGWALLTGKFRYQRPWRLVSFGTKTGFARVQLPDGSHRWVPYVQTSGSRGINRLGAIRFSTFTPWKDNNDPDKPPEHGPTIRPPRVPFILTGNHWLDLIATIIDHLPLVSASAKDGSGIGTPFPFGNKDSETRPTTIRAVTRLGDGITGVVGVVGVVGQTNPSPELQHTHSSTAYIFTGTFIDVKIGGVKQFYVWIGGQGFAVTGSEDYEQLLERLKPFIESWREHVAAGRKLRAAKAFARLLNEYRRIFSTDGAEFQPLVVEIGYGHRYTPWLTAPSITGHDVSDTHDNPDTPQVEHADDFHDPFTQANDRSGWQTNPNIAVYFGNFNPWAALRGAGRFVRSWHHRPSLTETLGLDDARPALPAAQTPAIAATPDTRADINIALTQRYADLLGRQATGSLTVAETTELHSLEAQAAQDPELGPLFAAVRGQQPPGSGPAGPTGPTGGQPVNPGPQGTAPAAPSATATPPGTTPTGGTTTSTTSTGPTATTSTPTTGPTTSSATNTGATTGNNPTASGPNPSGGPVNAAPVTAAPPATGVLPGADPSAALVANGQAAPGSQADDLNLRHHLGVRPGEAGPLHPHPASPWMNASNDGGLTVPGRSDNCLLWLMSVYHTYFGRPSVAPSNLTGKGFLARLVETWAGTKFQAHPDGTRGLSQVEEQLRQALPADADAGPMAFVITVDPHDRTAGHAYAVFARREPDPANPGQTRVVFYYADHGSTAGEPNRPPIDPDAQIYSMIFDQDGVPVQPAATAPTGGKRLSHALVAGRPTATGAADLTSRIDTLLSATGTPSTNVLDDLERQLDDMGLRPGGTHRRWNRLARMTSGSTVDVDAFVALMQEPDWRAAYVRAAETPNDVATVLTGEANDTPGRRIALATIFATNPAPAYAGRTDQEATALVTQLIGGDFRFEHQTTATVSGTDVQIAFSEHTTRTVRVEYAVLPPGQQVRLDWDAGTRTFRLAVAHDLDMSTPEARVRITRELGRVRLGGADFRSEHSGAQDVFLDVLQAYSYVGTADVSHVLAANRPPGLTGEAGDVAAAVRLVQRSRSEADRVLRVLLAAVAVDPAAAATITRLTAAEATNGDLPGRHLARLVGDLDLPPGRGRRVEQRRQQIGQLVAATLAVAGADLDQALAGQIVENELPSIVIAAVDHALFVRSYAQNRLGTRGVSRDAVLPSTAATFDATFLGAAEAARTELLAEIAARTDNPTSIIVPRLAGSGGNLDLALQSALRGEAATLGFAEPSREAAVLARWGQTLHSLGGRSARGVTPSTADQLDAERDLVRRTLAEPDRVSIQDGDHGDAHVLFQKRFTDAQGRTRVVEVTVHVHRFLADRAASIVDVQVATDLRIDFGRPMSGAPPRRVLVRTLLTDRSRVHDPGDMLDIHSPHEALQANARALHQAAAALGVTVQQEGRSPAFRLTWPNGDGPSRITLDSGPTRGSSIAEVRPPRPGSQTWAIRIPPSRMSRSGLPLDLAEALGMALGRHLAQNSGLVMTEQPTALAQAARLAAVAVGRATAGPMPSANVAHSRAARLAAEAHALIDGLGLRLDQPEHAARRAEVIRMTAAMFGSTVAAQVDAVLSDVGVAIADLADPTDQALAESARRSTRAAERGRLINDILLEQHRPGLVTETPAIAELPVRGTPLAGEPLARRIFTATRDVLLSRALTVSAHRRTGADTVVTARHDGLQGPVTITVRPGRLAAGTATHVRIDTVDRTVTITVAAGLTADNTTLHLAGALTQALETIARADHDRKTGPADVLGEHPLTSRVRQDTDGLSPADMALIAQIQWQADQLAVGQRPTALAALMILLHRAGVRDGQRHAKLRRELLLRALPTLAARRIDNLLDLDRHLATALGAMLPTTIGVPTPTRSVGRRVFTARVPTLGLESSGSMSTPPHQPLRPSVRRVAGRRADRLERFVAARRYKAARMGADRIAQMRSPVAAALTRTVLWPVKFVRARPWSLLTTKVRYQRPWRVFAFSNKTGYTRLRLPDGSHTWVAYTKTTASRTVNRLGAIRFSTFTPWKDNDGPGRGHDNQYGPTGVPPGYLFPLTGRAWIDAIAALLAHLPMITVSAKDGSGIGTPLPFGNKDTETRPTTVRALANLGEGVTGILARSDPSAALDRTHSFTTYAFIGTFLDVKIWGVKQFYIWIGGQGLAASGSEDYDKLMSDLREIRENAARVRTDGKRLAKVRSAFHLMKAINRYRKIFSDAGMEFQPLVFEVGYSHRYSPIMDAPDRLDWDTDHVHHDNDMVHGPFTQANDRAGLQTNPNVAFFVGAFSPRKLIRFLLNPVNPRAYGRGFHRVRTWVQRPGIDVTLQLTEARPMLESTLPPMATSATRLPDAVNRALRDRYRQLLELQSRTPGEALELTDLERLAERNPRLRQLFGHARNQVQQNRSNPGPPQLNRIGSRGSGPSYPMTMHSVRAVAAKYGIDLTGLRISINKAVRGWHGVTRPDGSIVLFREAFASEEDLARTLIHERFHRDELAVGLPYPSTADEAERFEDRAYEHEETWWENQPVRPEG